MPEHAARARARREEPLDLRRARPGRRAARTASDPEQEALLADSVGLALLVVLDTLAPAERLAFVLHDMFAVPFDEIAPIVGRIARPRPGSSPAAPAAGCSGAATAPDPDLARQREVVDAFFAAARERRLRRAASPCSTPTSCCAPTRPRSQLGAAPETRGAAGVAGFSRYARGAKPALLDGAAAAVWMRAGRPRVVYGFTISDDRIIAIDLIADPARLGRLDLAVLGD